MARLNLIYNPSFRLGTVGWVSVSGALMEQSDTRGYYGSGSLRVEKSASAGSGVATADYIPVTGGESYSISAYAGVDIGDPSADLAMRISWYTISATLISENTTATDVVEGSNSWSRITGVYVAPGSAAYAKVSVIQLSSGASGEAFYIDAVLVEESHYVGGFIDNLTQAQETAIVNRGLTQSPNLGPSGMRLNADIILGSLVLNTIDEDSTLWVCTDINGWWGHAAPESPDITRGVDDGSYDVTGRYQARVMTLSGTFIPKSTEALGAARDRLVQATNLVRTGAWLRTNEQPTRAAYVRLSGKPQIQTVTAKGRTEFSIGLKAADPIKYLWNDSDPDGYMTETITGLDEEGVVPNPGTADVTVKFTVVGPMGAGSTIYNETSDETMVLVQSLRGAASTATVIKAELTDEYVTLTTSEPHGLVVGDIIEVSNVGAPFDSVNETFTVSAVSEGEPYTLGYYRQAVDRPEQDSSGSVGLASNDVLEIDTYERSVKFNGEIVGQRYRLETLVDWIKLVPGNNTIMFNDSIDESLVSGKQKASGLVTLETLTAHFYAPGDQVDVELPHTAELKRKSLTSNVATLVTQEDHGFSVGDEVTVSSTTSSDIATKEVASNVVTLTTVEDGGFSVGDSVTVNLPASASIATKRRASDVVTLTTTGAHGFSVGDEITVSLPGTANLSTKAISSGNVATLGTSSAHGFSIGDTISVALPTTGDVIKKNISGTSVTLTTASPHGFSVGDKITVSALTTLTLTGTRTMSGAPNYLGTLTTTAAHRLTVGDRVTVVLPHPSVTALSSRSSSGTTRTIVTATAHGIRVGERVTVSISGGNTDYDGTWVVASIPTTTSFTYVAEDSLTQSSTATSGTFQNKTITEGFNGVKIVEAIPSSTTFQFRSYPDAAASSGGSASSGYATNTTNQQIDGIVTITAVPSSTTFQYEMV